MVLANYKKVLRKEKLSNGKNYTHVLCKLLYNFLEDPVKDWAKMLEEEKEEPSEPTLFD